MYIYTCILACKEVKSQLESMYVGTYVSELRIYKILSPNTLSKYVSYQWCVRMSPLVYHTSVSYVHTLYNAIFQCRLLNNLALSDTLDHFLEPPELFQPLKFSSNKWFNDVSSICKVMCLHHTTVISHINFDLPIKYKIHTCTCVYNVLALHDH